MNGSSFLFQRKEARQICGTNLPAPYSLTRHAGVGTPIMAEHRFDVVVIDEAAQAMEPACWIALLRGERALLAGDHLQLPATVLSSTAARMGLQQPLFARLVPRGGGDQRPESASDEPTVSDEPATGEPVPSPGAELLPVTGATVLAAAGPMGNGCQSSGICSTLLTVQYRMHDDIMAWSNGSLYGGRLTAAPAVAAHVLAELPGVAFVPGVTDAPCLLLDTTGAGAEEVQDPVTRSWCNAVEAATAMAHVHRLLAAGVAPSAIGVITPYAAQVQLLRAARPEGLGAELEISTVDGFQGREKEAVVFSAVRAGAELGFVADTRRANVAVTRARRHFALVCDPDTLRRDPLLARLVLHFEDCGVYEMAEQLLEGEG